MTIWSKNKINEYAELLLSKSEEAVILRRAEIIGGNWEPQANDCHRNVSTWCEHNEQYESIRGWLYFDLPGANCVKFVAHSAVLTPEKELRDITPSNASQDYPFIPGNLPEEEYVSLVDSIENGEINFVPENA